MSFASKVLYTGDGATTDYTVNMPYISQDHVKVYVNEILQLTTMHYNWSGTSTIRFVDAPAIDAAIEIKRITSPNNILVDFVDGSVLNADSLDTAYLHNYYLGQEYSDSFNEIINNALTTVATELGVIEVDTDFVINQMIVQMLEQPAAANLQARIADIDLNAEAIITLGEGLQVQINTLATGIAATIYIQPGEPVPGVGGVPDPIPQGARWYDSDDNNAPYIYQGVAWVSIQDPRIGNAVSDISVLQVTTADNAAAIVDEAFARTTQDSAFASTFALIGAETGGGTAFLLDLNTVKVGPTESLSSRFTSLQASIDANGTTGTNNAAAITAEQSARVSADSANAADITALDVRVTSAEGDISTNVSAISGLQTQITTNANGISASASDITQLQTDVDLRTTAFHQALPPTANNSGDMWVDTDDGKLYIWNGASWIHTPNAAVTANAGAISTLQTDVTTNAGNITVNAADITTLDGQIATIQGDIIANSSAIDAVEINVSTNAGNISTNALAITTLESDIDLRATVFDQSTPPTANNTGDIWIDTDDNKLYVWSGVAWVPRQDVAIAGNASAIGTLQTDVTAAEGNIASNASDITNLNTSVGTLNGQMSTAQADITANASSIVTAEGNITSNASDISSLTSTVDLKTQTFVQAAPPTATATGDIWYDSDDDNKIHRWNGTSWVDVTNPVIAANASAVSSLQTLTTSQGGLISTNASDITNLSASVTSLDGEVNTAQVDIVANASAVSTAEGDIVNLEAKYGVTLNVNGYITGFAINQGAESGSFVILADKFAVVDPTGDPLEPEYVPFSIAGGKIVMTGDVSIDGDLIVSGTINGALALSTTVAHRINADQIGADSINAVHINANAVTAEAINVTNLAAVNADLGNITAGTITMNTAGYIRGGQTAYNTGTGFYLGYSGAAYKFSIGNGGTQQLSWDGTTLTVKGDIRVGSYNVNSPRSILAQANTDRTHPHASSWTEYKKFEVTRDGTIVVVCAVKLSSVSGGVETFGGFRIKVDGVVKYTYNTVGSLSTHYNSIVIAEGDQYITVELDGGGTRDIDSGPFDCDTVITSCWIESGPLSGEQTITN